MKVTRDLCKKDRQSNVVDNARDIKNTKDCSEYAFQASGLSRQAGRQEGSYVVGGESVGVGREERSPPLAGEEEGKGSN